MSRFEGKTVLVVGGAQGMGLACAGRFGAEGAGLALFDIEDATLVRLRRDRVRLGVSCALDHE